MKKVSVYKEVESLTDIWKPKVVGKLENMHIKIAKLNGEFLWHKHEKEEELFYVLKGELIIKFRDKDVVLNEHDFLIIPKGIEHMPVAKNEVSIMLIEPRTTVNTGNVINERTVTI